MRPMAAKGAVSCKAGWPVTPLMSDKPPFLLHGRMQAIGGALQKCGGVVFSLVRSRHILCNHACANAFARCCCGGGSAAAVVGDFGMSQSLLLDVEVVRGLACERANGAPATLELLLHSCAAIVRQRSLASPSLWHLAEFHVAAVSDGMSVRDGPATPCERDCM